MNESDHSICNVATRSAFCFSIVFFQTKVSETNDLPYCRTVREAQPNSTAYGGLTCVTNYELIAKHEQVVDSACMPDRLAPEASGHEDAMVIVTKHQVFSNGDDD